MHGCLLIAVALFSRPNSRSPVLAVTQRELRRHVHACSLQEPCAAAMVLSQGASKSIWDVMELIGVKHTVPNPRCHAARTAAHHCHASNVG